MHELAIDFQLAQAAFKRGDYAKAIELARGLNDRIAGVTEVRRLRGSPCPSVSIVVASHRNVPAVSACLRSIKEETSSTEAEHVFVDNGNEGLIDEVEKAFDSFIYLRPPFNVGASAARNLGVRFSTADIVIFIDDDGVPEPGFVNALVDRIRRSDAAACRGRVLPFKAHRPKPPHYDLGDQCIPALPNVEGASAWRRHLFDRFGGFDVLLAGHEGLKLCGSMYPFFGTLGFLYEPSAVLRHDYAPDKDGAASKADRHAALDAYLAFCGLRPNALRRVFQSTRGNVRDRYLAARWISAKPPTVRSEGRNRISVITVAQNAAELIKDYSEGWRSQTCNDFEIVFVDRGSSDDTRLGISAAWRDDPRFHLIEAEGATFCKAFNLAVANATTDICAIGAIDEISRTDRISRTLDFFSGNSGAECVTFHTFSERRAFCSELPGEPNDIATRQFLGAPFPFGAFAFRKSGFPLPLDAERDSNIYQDWFARNYARRRLNGQMLPLPLVYQHLDRERNLVAGDPKDSSPESVYRNASLVLGSLDELDKANIDRLTGRTAIKSVEEMNDLQAWLIGLLTENRRIGVYPADELDAYLLATLSRAVLARPEPVARTSGRSPLGAVSGRLLRLFSGLNRAK
jgi:glycosyltransferase involved in cell wall biosynthesis